MIKNISLFALTVLSISLLQAQWQTAQSAALGRAQHYGQQSGASRSLHQQSRTMLRGLR